MSWLSPYRWLLIGGLILALTLGYFAWADHIGDVREAQVLAKIEKARAAENAKNAQITATWQKGKDDALIDANKRAQASKAAADKLATVNRGLRDDLTDQRRKLSTASIDAARKYAATANSVFGECSAEVERLAGEAGGHASDSLMYQTSWPK
jgi:hypothetical protein